MSVLWTIVSIVARIAIALIAFVATIMLATAAVEWLLEPNRFRRLVGTVVLLLLAGWLLLSGLYLTDSAFIKAICYGVASFVASITLVSNIPAMRSRLGIPSHQ